MLVKVIVASPFYFTSYFTSSEFEDFEALQGMFFAGCVLMAA